MLSLDALLWNSCDGRMRVAILDRHARALADMRQHRMRRVSEECRSSLAPAIERIAIMQRPFVVAFGRAQQSKQRRVPAREGLDHLGALALLRPRLVGPGIALDMRDEIDELAAAHHEMNDM